MVNLQGWMNPEGAAATPCSGCHVAKDAAPHFSMNTSPYFGASCTVCHQTGAMFGVSCGKVHPGAGGGFIEDRIENIPKCRRAGTRDTSAEEPRAFKAHLDPIPIPFKYL
jgi:hypothetical protein